MKISIRTKIILTFTVLMAIVLAGQLIFNRFFAEDLYVSYKERNMSSVYSLIEAEFDGEYESLDLLLESYENQHSMNIIILYEDTLLYMTTSRFINHPQDFKYNYNLNDNPEPSSDRPGGIPERGVLELRETFEYMGDEVSVHISVSNASIIDSVSVFSNASLMITISVFLIGFVVCLLISNSITKPIRSALAVTNKLAKLDFTDCVDEKVSSTELSGLAIGINEMSQKLKSATDDLYSANERLRADIDYQKKIEDMRREFIANVSHEMKTPLALMQIYADNLKSDIPNIDKDYYYDTIIEESQNLSDMLSSLLDISSIENGLMKMNLKEGSLSLVCQNFLQKIGPILEDYEIVYDIADDVVAVFDEKYIEMAMRNYIVNATEHTKKGGLIKISLDINKQFSVYNEGTQIKDEDSLRIWDSFYRADKSHNRDSKNIGLGLSIVKTVIEGHGGVYKTENKDNGVLFSFTI